MRCKACSHRRVKRNPAAERSHDSHQSAVLHSPRSNDSSSPPPPSGAARCATKRCPRASGVASTRRPMFALPSRCATPTSSTRHSTSSKATRCTSPRRASAHLVDEGVGGVSGGGWAAPGNTARRCSRGAPSALPCYPDTLRRLSPARRSRIADPNLADPGLHHRARPLRPAGSLFPAPASTIAGYRASHPDRRDSTQGGLQVVLQARPVAGQTLDSGTLEGTRQTLERRVNGLGVSEPLIQTRGDDQIIVELPGVDDPQEADRHPAADRPAGDHRSRRASTCPRARRQHHAWIRATDAAGAASPRRPGSDARRNAAAATPVADAPPQRARLRDDHQRRRSRRMPTSPPATPGMTGRRLRAEGRRRSKFFEYTSSHLGQPMSIVLDKEVISSPRSTAPSRREGIIEGVPPTEVDDLVIQLKAGALACRWRSSRAAPSARPSARIRSTRASSPASSASASSASS